MFPKVGETKLVSLKITRNDINHKEGGSVFCHDSLTRHAGGECFKTNRFSFLNDEMTNDVSMTPAEDSSSS